MCLPPSIHQDGLAFDCEGNLWFGGLQTNSLYRWKYTPGDESCSDVSTATAVATSVDNLHWIDTFAFNGTTLFATLRGGGHPSQRLLYPDACTFWTEHSDRAGVDSWLAVSGALLACFESCQLLASRRT